MTCVQPMFERVPEPALRRLQLRMRGVLRPTRHQYQPQQMASICDAGGYRQISSGARPSSRPYLRGPLIGETELSVEEIAHARKIGVIA